MSTPWSNGSLTAACLVCSGPLPSGRLRTTGSGGCRQALWRRRHQSPVQLPEPARPGRSRKEGTVYECLARDARQAGKQRCECEGFMCRLGPMVIRPAASRPSRSSSCSRADPLEANSAGAPGTIGKSVSPYRAGRPREPTPIARASSKALAAWPSPPAAAGPP